MIKIMFLKNVRFQKKQIAPRKFLRAIIEVPSGFEPL